MSPDLAQELFELSDDLFCVANLDGYFLDINPAWQRALGWTTKELCAKPFFEFVHTEDRARTYSEAAKLAQGQKTIRFENRYIHKNGGTTRLQWNATLSKNGELFLAIARVIK